MGEGKREKRQARRGEILLVALADFETPISKKEKFSFAFSSHNHGNNKT